MGRRRTFWLTRWATRLVSTIALAGLLGGIPWGLIALAGWPLPREVTLPRTLEQLQELVATPITDRMIVNLLAIAAWLIWASFAASVATEATAALRGRPSRRLTVFSPLQRIAGWLVSGMTAGVLAVATLTPAVTLPPAAPAAGAATAPAPPNSNEATVTLPAPHQQRPAEQPPIVCAGEHVLVIDGQRYAYVVQDDDSLWRIAELCLGNGNEWRTIWNLNRDRHFPEVGGTLHDPDLIFPGWDLYLPDDAVPPPDAQPLLPEGEPAPAPEPEQPAPQPPPPPSPPVTPPLEATPTPPTASPPSPTPAATPSQTADPAGAAGDDRADPPADDEGGPSSVLPIAFGAALIAATLGVATAVKLRRRGAAADPRVGRRGHRRGHRPQRVDQGTVDQRLHVAAQRLDVDRLDQALRLLAGGLAARATDLPDIIGVHVEHGDVHLLLTAATNDPPPPWQPNHTQWTLPAGVELPPAGHGTLAALPALVTVGSQAARGGRTGGAEHLLLDLERLGCLAITGDPEGAGDLLRYLASELAMNTWSDDVEIILAGWPHHEAELLTALNPDRVQPAPGSTSEEVAKLRQRARLAAGALASVGAADALAGRVHDQAGDSWMPTVLLAADPTPAGLAAIGDLATDLARIGRCAIAMVAVGDLPTRGDQPEAVHAVTVTAEHGIHVPFLGTTLAAAGLPLHELEPLARVMATARDGTEEPVPPATEPEPWATGTDAAGALLPTQPAAPALDGDHEPESAVEAAGLTQALGFLDTHQPPPAPVEAEEAEPPPAGAPEPPPPPARPATEQRHEPAVLPGPVGAAPRPERASIDPTLDIDLAAWYQPAPDRPRIRVLGPVVDATEVIDAPGQPPKPGRLLLLAEVLVYLAQCGRRGATPSRLDEDLWPGQEVTNIYRRATISRARQWAGRRPDGSPWLAEVHYRLEEGYLLDWHLFRRLRARSQSLGLDGAADLRTALELVRGVPLAGYERIAATTRSPYSWLPTSDIDPDHLVAAIVDTAHELAHLCLATGDTAGARWAVQQAWLADPDRSYDQPWQVILRVHAAEHHLAELEATVAELMRIREAEVEEDLDPATYTLLREILPASYWDSSRRREPATP